MKKYISAIIIIILAILVIIWGITYYQSKDRVLSAGKSCIKFSEFDKAIELFNKVIEEDPGNLEAHIYLGIAYGKKREYEEALKNFGIAKNSEEYENLALPAEIHNDVGLIYYLLEQYELAVGEFERSIDANPKYSEAYFNLGVTYSIAERSDDAIAAYKKVLEIDPKNSFSHWNLAVNLEKTGNLQGAVKHWEEYVDNVPAAFRHPDIKRHIDELKEKIAGK
ncbi:tetratricopeptide repeat protein [Candidatus Omnitrophota bacterium]